MFQYLFNIHFKKKDNKIYLSNMENIEKDLLKERKIVHQERKYLRVKPVIWIRKYLWIVILISTLVITGILGV